MILNYCEEKEKLDKKRIENLIAMIEAREYLRPSCLADEWDVHATTISRYIQKFVEEIDKLDSKIPADAYIYHSKKAIWINKKAFEYYMKHYVELNDDVRRKHVNKFKNDKKI